MKIPDLFNPVIFTVAIGLAFFILFWLVPSRPPVPTEIIIHFDSPLTIHIEQEPK